MLATCCKQVSQHERILIDIDSLTATNADSARQLLLGMSEEMKHADEDTRAYYNMLKVKADERAKKEHVSDSLICAELLGLRSGQIDPPRPSERTADYYRSRPCPVLIACACRIYARHRLSISSAEASTDTKAIQSPT